MASKKGSTAKTGSKSKPYDNTPIQAGFLAEAEVAYNLRPSYSSDMQLLNRSKAGLSPEAALDFLSISGFTQNEFQETFKTTVKTIQNHVSRALTLDASLSEKLIKSFALFDKGIELFGNASEFHRWLTLPAFGLGNMIPITLMDTVTGMKLIEEELIRIEYGALA